MFSSVEEFLLHVQLRVWTIEHAYIFISLDYDVFIEVPRHNSSSADLLLLLILLMLLKQSCFSIFVLFFWITDGLIQGMMVESQKSRSQPAPPTRPLYLSSLCNITVNALHVCQRHLWLEFGNCITREERPAVGRRPIEMRRRSLWPMAGRHWSCHQWRARECSEGWGWRRSRWRP